MNNDLTDEQRARALELYNTWAEYHGLGRFYPMTAEDAHAWLAVEGPLPSVVGASLAQAEAVLALADEQHTRNRLAAITAAHRGITLPPDLHALTEEGHLP